MSTLTRDRLDGWLCEFEYESSRPGVGLRHLPGHVHAPLLEYLWQRIQHLADQGQVASSATVNTE